MHEGEPNMSMIEFDAATAFLIGGFIYILLSGTVRWLLFRYDHAAANIWATGGFLIGMSLVLFSYRPYLNAVMAYPVTNFLLYTGLILKFYGLLKEFKPSPPAWLILVLPAVHMAVYEYLRHFHYDKGLQFVWASLVIAVSLITVGLLSMGNGRRADSGSAWAIGLIYFLGGSVLILRNVGVLFTQDEPSPLSPHLVNAVSILFGLFIGVMANFAYLGIFLERSKRTSARIAAENARLEEAARLNDQIAHLDRQRSMGAIATSLCHELSQPLTNVTVICEYGQLEMSHQPLCETRQKKIFEDIARNANLGREILERIRHFIRPREPVQTAVSLQVVAADVSQLMLDGSSKERATIRIVPPDREPLVMGDPILLSQIMLNLYRNAVQAMQGQADKRIAVEFTVDAQHVCVRVRDNGPGIAPDMLGRIGTPFLSTKPEGLGVGFSISRALAEQHGGTLQIVNAATGGAVAELRLPALQVPA